VPTRPRLSSDGRPLLSHWYHEYGEVGTEAAARWYAEQFPDAAVTVDWRTGDYENAVTTALAAGDGPDVFEYANGPTVELIRSGQVVELTDLVADVRSDFNAAILDRMTFEGKLYAIPQVIDTQLLIYRPSMLRAAGVTPPKTTLDLVQAAIALTTQDRAGIFVGSDGGVETLLGPTLWSVGCDYLTPDTAAAGPAVGFTDPAVATAFGALRELYTSGAMLLDAPAHWAEPSALVQGRCAMQWTGLWTFPTLAAALGDDFGVLPWPRFSDTTGAPSVPIGAYGAVVNAAGTDVALAREYVRWLWVAQHDLQLDWAQSYGFHIPARHSLSADADALAAEQPAEVVELVGLYGHPQTPLWWTAGCGTALRTAASRIITAGADAATELATAAAEVTAELERVRG
jgi:multiple sugar transport system substrate-binding protein